MKTIQMVHHIESSHQEQNHQNGHQLPRADFTIPKEVQAGEEEIRPAAKRLMPKKSLRATKKPNRNWSSGANTMSFPNNLQ